MNVWSFLVFYLTVPTVWHSPCIKLILVEPDAHRGAPATRYGYSKLQALVDRGGLMRRKRGFPDKPPSFRRKRRAGIWWRSRPVRCQSPFCGTRKRPHHGLRTLLERQHNCTYHTTNSPNSCGTYRWMIWTSPLRLPPWTVLLCRTLRIS
jgi:hypothetical protein